MTFSFIQISDHHLFESETGLHRGFSTAYSFRAVLRHIARHAAAQADFLVSTGDLVSSPAEATYRAVADRLGVSVNAGRAPGPIAISCEGLNGFPTYLMPGNHDDRDTFFRCFFPATAPQPLMNLCFTHKGVQFVCLDWGTDAYSCAYPETLAFLDTALQTDLPSVILTHHQVAPVGVGWLDAFIAPGLARFWEIVRGRKVSGVLAGHVHLTHEQLVHGIPVLTVRSTGFQFARQDEPLLCLQSLHYRFVTIHDGVLTSRIFEVPLDE